MVAVITSFLLAVMLLFSHAAYAKAYGAKICEQEEYYCYISQRGDTWEKLFSDPEERDAVMRLNRMNTKLYPGLKIAIPDKFSGSYMTYSPFPLQIDPLGKKSIKVSLTHQAFGAYDEDGNLQHWGPISGGRGYCPDVGRRCGTPAGKYFIYHKRGSGCVSSKYPVGKGGAPMPYCMFFNGGFALHGSYTVPGYHDSHGCVRLFVNDAKWLNQNFTNGTRVEVIISK